MKKLISLLALFVITSIAYCQQTSFYPSAIKAIWESRVMPSAVNIDSTFNAYNAKAENPTSVNTASLTVTTSTVTVGVTGLTSDSVLSGHNYIFEGVLFCTSASTGGFRVSVGGTATATSVRYEVQATNNVNDSLILSSTQTALDGVTGSVSGAKAYTNVVYKIKGSILVNGSGTLYPKFAQAVATSTSSVNIGSYFYIRKAY